MPSSEATVIIDQILSISARKPASESVGVHIPRQNGYVRCNQDDVDNIGQNGHTEKQALDQNSHIEKREVQVTLEMDNILDKNHPIL